MSRIGKLAITIPEGVKVHVDGSSVVAEGPKGKLQQEMPAGIGAEISGDTLRVTRESDQRQTRAYHGLMRKLIANLVQGGGRVQTQYRLIKMTSVVFEPSYEVGAVVCIVGQHVRRRRSFDSVN